MKRMMALVAVMVIGVVLCRAQSLTAFNGQCAKGGQAAVLQGLPTVATQPLSGSPVSTGSGVLASYPSCTVSVFFTGTTNLASIYQNNLSVPTVLANPFQANTDGSFLFYAGGGVGYDVTASSSTSGGPPMPTSFTQTAVLGSAANWLNPGAFGSAQNNFFTTSTVGTQSVQQILAGIDTTYGVAICCLTDAVTGAMTVPAGATGVQADGGGFYIVNNSAVLGGGVGGGAVGVYSVAVCNATGSKCWGANPLASDTPGHPAANLFGIEVDTNVSNATTAGSGIILNGNFTAQPINFPAVNIVQPFNAHNYTFTDGVRVNDGATSNFEAINIGAVSTGNGVASQQIALTGRDGGGVGHTAKLSATLNGDVFLAPVTGRGVQIAGALDQSTSGNFANACSMTGGTTCTFTLSQTYANSPLCFVSPQNTAAAATYTSGGAFCAASGTTVTITAAANNSGTWGALVIGNPN